MTSPASYVGRAKAQWLMAQLVEAIRDRRWKRSDVFANDLRERGYEVHVGRHHAVINGEPMALPEVDGISWYLKERLANADIDQIARRIEQRLRMNRQ